MRFIGNKESMVEDIYSFVMENVPIRANQTLFDAFCGTGSVADRFKNDFDIVINDNLFWATTYSAGRLFAPTCTFELLGFNPFDYLNENKNTVEGFIFNTYAPTLTNRMYFTPENAGRIDYFRSQIEEWYLNERINDKEYAFLLSSLIESVSRVSNTAGVYGAYLKKWDSRALKPISFIAPSFEDKSPNSVQVLNAKIEDVIHEIECDILYLDPPYTQNQYGTQYHLLETLILDDNPSVSKVTGSRPVTSMRSDWSKEIKANILLDKILSKTKAKYIVLSYSSSGLMSKSFIEASLKRYGKPETYLCKKMPYKKYENWKSRNTKQNFEYLFFIEKKGIESVVYESPLNYIGNKTRVIDEIQAALPNDVDTFIDAFGGGFNVGININATNVFYNEYNPFVRDLVESFRHYDTYSYVRYMNKVIDEFALTRGNKNAYLEVRDYYNSFPPEKRDPRLLLVVILYSYNQQIRFNSSFEFNNPTGIRWFNDKILEKLVSFSRRIKEINVRFHTGDYSQMHKYLHWENSFIYLDPPYMLTNGSYNDGKRGFNGWDSLQEKELFAFLDHVDSSKQRFMLSYVLEHKGETNFSLLNWIKEKDYNLIELGDILGISGSTRKEILVTNYEK